MTRYEQRAEILEKIGRLKLEPPGDVRDLRIRLLALERDRVDDHQILDHFQRRNLLLREALLAVQDETGAPVFTPRRVDELEADYRIEGQAPMPTCQACGEPLRLGFPRGE